MHLLNHGLDLESALGDLKNNKSRDPEGLINEIFIPKKGFYLRLIDFQIVEFVNSSKSVEDDLICRFR